MKEQPLKKPAIKTAMRLPADLHADLKDAATREGHSMNVEMVSRLTAMLGGASLHAILAQNRQILEENRELRAEIKKTQEMVQSIIDALSPRR
jgi:hypothetical protein